MGAVLVDPEIGMSIIQLGLVRDVSIENDIAHMQMLLTTPFCPYGPALIEMTRLCLLTGCWRKKIIFNNITP